jgi:hypothetical protein
MPRRHGWRYLIGLLSAVLQIALPLGVSYAEARVAADGGRAQAHVESGRSSNCQPVHSPECGLCRFMANHSATAITPATVVDARGTSRAAPPSAPAFPRVPAHELQGARGPPDA